MVYLSCTKTLAENISVDTVPCLLGDFRLKLLIYLIANGSKVIGLKFCKTNTLRRVWFTNVNSP